MVEAILCDIDGTLVDSNHLHAKAWQDAFAAVGMTIDFEETWRQIGKGGDELMPVFLPKWKLVAVQEPLDAYRKFIFQTDYLKEVKPFPRVREFLLHLKEKGIRLSLASSASREDLKIYKKIANMEDLIEESSSSDDAEHSKPHGDIFAVTLKKLGVPADRAIALGDTPYDAQAAGKCGLRTIGVTSAGPLFEPGFRSLGWGGRHLVVGFVGGPIPALPTNLPLMKGAALMGVDVRQFSLFESHEARDHLQTLGRWAAETRLTPPVGQVFEWSDFGAALTFALSGRGMGKTVLRSRGGC